MPTYQYCVAYYRQEEDEEATTDGPFHHVKLLFTEVGLKAVVACDKEKQPVGFGTSKDGKSAVFKVAGIWFRVENTEFLADYSDDSEPFVAGNICEFKTKEDAKEGINIEASVGSYDEIAYIPFSHI
jgi:hypothetical protein